MRPYCAAVLLFASAAFAQTADLVLRNGKIVTLDPAVPTAQAIAVRGGRIAATGTGQQIRRFIGERTRVVDLHGMTAVPGFIEGHAHFMGTGQARMMLNLREARRWDDIVQQVARAAKTAKPGEWILGRGWHQAKWDRVPEPNVEGFPVHATLSQAAPDNPVLLTHASGHASFVNAAALRAAGIAAATADPADGHVQKDAAGNPTGLLQEGAQALVSRALGQWRAKRSAAERAGDVRRALSLAADECVAKGITSFQDAGSDLATVDTVKAMAEAGELPLRLWMMLRGSNRQLEQALPRYRIAGAGNGFLTVRAIKRMIDGALGSRGAWLLQPYADLPPGAPNPSGLRLDDSATLRQTAALALQHGFQLCVHAIGDRANREVLDLFEQTFREHPEKKDLRWRIEHAQHLDPADIPRFGKLGVIAAMQGVHCTSDGPYVTARLGAKRAAAGAYAWRSLLDSGAIVGNGTDAPVEDVGPLASFYASVSRKLREGSRFYPEQRMTREEALRSYTLSNAYAAFEEDVKGSLQPGKLADITVLSRDIMTIPEDEILATDVVYTIVGGKTVYSNAAYPRK